MSLSTCVQFESVKSNVCLQNSWEWLSLRRLVVTGRGLKGGFWATERIDFFCFSGFWITSSSALPPAVAVFSQHVQTGAIWHRHMNFLGKTVGVNSFWGTYLEDSRNLRRWLEDSIQFYGFFFPFSCVFLSLGGYGSPVALSAIYYPLCFVLLKIAPFLNSDWSQPKGNSDRRWKDWKKDNQCISHPLSFFFDCLWE